jgi:hypothetical protein
MRKAGRPSHPVPARKPEPWESAAVTKQLQEILDDLEIQSLDSEARDVFQRILHRQRYFQGLKYLNNFTPFGGDAKGHIIFVIRCITESNGNEGALIGPIVRAVSSCLTPALTDRGLELIEAFDKIAVLEVLATMRSLDIFSETSLAHYLSLAIRNKLRAILEPALPATKPMAAKPAPKPPRSLSRIPEVEKNIALGLKLLGLRAATPHHLTFGRSVRRQFEVDGQTAGELMKVARVFGARPEIYRRLSWEALLQLSSPAIPASARAELERRIMAGERIGAPQIRQARRKQQTGRPRRPVNQPAQRMAA